MSPLPLDGERSIPTIVRSVTRRKGLAGADEPC